jgi:small subunit ribosomal protein S15
MLKSSVMVKTDSTKSTDKVAKVGSSSAQITDMSARILELTEHLKVNKKDFMARRGLLVLVGRRKRLLAYLSKKNPAEYLALIQKLGLRK